MVQRCEHCGQTVMATDKQCWHCGRFLNRGQGNFVKPTPETSDSQTATLPSLPAILLYAGLTAVSLLLLITTTRTIGHAPLFLAGKNNQLLAGWQPFTDGQLQFTLNVPQSWYLFEVAQAPEVDALRQNVLLQDVNRIVESLAADTELLFLSTEDTAVFADGVPVFVLVAQSQRLQQLTPDEIIKYAQQQMPEHVAFSNAPQPAAAAQESAGRLLFNINQDEQVWRCIEQFNPGSRSVYLVFTCTSFAQFPTHLDDFEIILSSFQPLNP